MSSNRRGFFRQAAVAAGLGVRGLPLTAQQRSSAMPTARASASMAAFGLRYPIFCAGFGLSATAELAIAVSNGGGLGALGTANASADMVRERVSRTKSGTSRPFAVNYLLRTLIEIELSTCPWSQFIVPVAVKRMRVQCEVSHFRAGDDLPCRVAPLV